jgi:hypothetical protein
MSHASLHSIGWLLNCEAKTANGSYLDKPLGDTTKSFSPRILYSVTRIYSDKAGGYNFVGKEKTSIGLHFVAPFVGKAIVTKPKLLILSDQVSTLNVPAIT